MSIFNKKSPWWPSAPRRTLASIFIAAHPDQSIHSSSHQPLASLINKALSEKKKSYYADSQNPEVFNKLHREMFIDTDAGPTGHSIADTPTTTSSTAVMKHAV